VQPNGDVEVFGGVAILPDVTMLFQLSKGVQESFSKCPAYPCPACLLSSTSRSSTSAAAITLAVEAARASTCGGAAAWDYSRRYTLRGRLKGLVTAASRGRMGIQSIQGGASRVVSTVSSS